MPKGKLLAVGFVWLLIVAAGAMAWKWLVAPSREEARRAEQIAREQEEEARRQETLHKTSSSSAYDHHINLALDSFSGYCILRSADFRGDLSRERIKLELVNDAADYSRRIQGLKSGEFQLAVFTVDALVKVCAQIGENPATIVAVIDETRGADAMVAYKSAVPNIDALNDAETRFVVTPDSPSETLARVVMTHFNLDNLSTNPFINATDAGDVYRRYQQSKPDTRQVFVLWEPYVSKMLENDKTHVVIDSSRFRGYIVDVIVANRDFLAKHPDVVATFVECYLRSVYRHRDDMIQLVLEDAKSEGAPLTNDQAKKLVEGVWWKNTQENLAHFALHDGESSLQLLEDIIANITEVLLSTGAIETDPTGGKPNLLYFKDTLAGIKQSGFHPGAETLRDDVVILPPLSDDEWQRLEPVGTLGVQELVFARGTAVLTDRSRVILDDLVEKLRAWPQYYVLIRGNASRQGDLEANKRLAEARAKAAEDYLRQQGIGENRVRAVGVEPSGTTAVSFVLGSDRH